MYHQYMPTCSSQQIALTTVSNAYNAIVVVVLKEAMTSAGWLRAAARWAACPDSSIQVLAIHNAFWI